MQAIAISRDADEKDVLSYVLRKAGLAVATSSDVTRVLNSWSDHPADLLVLALDQDQNPEQTLEAVRQSTQTWLIMIIAASGERTVCRLLDGGADVVLERPVSPQTLSAHARALARRAGAIPSFVLPALELEQIVLDPSARTVTLKGRSPSRLTQLEFRLLYVLMTNRGQVVPNEVLIERVWGYSGEGNRDLVRGLVSRLRHKVELDPESPSFIETISGVGYRFSAGEI